MKFPHLHTHSPFSFLDGGSSIQELVDRAADLGMEALAVTDHDNMSAAVKFRDAALRRGLKPIQGVEATLKWCGTEPSPHLTLLAENSEGYRNICAALTRAHLDNPRRKPALDIEVMRDHAAGVIALSGCRRGEIPSRILKGDYAGALEAARKYVSVFGNDQFFIELSEGLLPGSTMLNERLSEIAGRLGLGMVATANVHYSCKAGFVIHDLLTCVRTLSKLDDVNPERKINAENYLKTPAEMEALFAQYPAAVNGSSLLAERCSVALEVEGKCYPSFPTPEGTLAREMLRGLVREGARKRYGRITAKIRDRLEHELGIITALGYDDYFLIVHDIVNYARRRGIRHAGRGSAADSAVAYCLNLTDVDPIARGLLFERFMSLERAQSPDIDVDFDARYRDEVAEYASKKYGADKVASVCTYNTFQARSAVRDLGKAMGFSEEEIDRLAKRLPHVPADDLKSVVERLPELRDLRLDPVKFGHLLEASEKIAGFPRFLSTHLGGIVISRKPLTELTPLQEAAKGVVVTQFDKDDIEALGLIKLDLLSLRMLSVVEDSVAMINGSPGSTAAGSVDYDKIPVEDRESYRMIRQGRTIGMFQLESPAQRALQGRLAANRFEDLVASVALIRPGPVQGNMVDPFVLRRRGFEPVSYVDPRLEAILNKTYGVVLFQEQVIQIAVTVAGFTPGEADRLRRVMSHNRSVKEMQEICKVFVARAVENGTPQAVAEKIAGCIKSYAGYGFCEAHAASFAVTAAKTAYLVNHYPAHFFAAILSHQPMGYYPANTICVEARRRGVRVLGPCINSSGKAFTVEDGAIRTSLACVKDMTGQALDRIIGTRRARPFTSLFDFCRRVDPPRNVAENLILCGTFDSISTNRRSLLWQLSSVIEAARLQVDDGRQPDLRWNISEDHSSINDFSLPEKVLYEYRVLGITISDHPMMLMRSRLKAEGYLSSENVLNAKPGTVVKVAGFPVRPHRPPTRSGKTVVFLSLEDEHGLIDITVFEKVYQLYGQLIFADPAPALQIVGRLEKRGNGVSVTAQRIEILQL
ncbi:MAG: DNA polymerase III subunit alpha [Firmicutes bacterium]|nr:DNA polymerase III subunit alpha [Bacillota bacterium]